MNLSTRLQFGLATDNFELLDDTEWDFHDSVTNSHTHSLHPYPAKFIPQIPRSLISNLSRNGETVYEPFLGSGTTAVEANTLGRNVIGNDVNELAVLISRVKTTAISSELLSNLDSFSNRIAEAVEDLYDGSSNRPLKPCIPRLDLWFEPHVIDELTIIKNAIDFIELSPVRDLAHAAMSGIIITVSRQDSDTRYVRVAKSVKPLDTLRRFSAQLNKLRRIVDDSSNEIAKGSANLKVADSRNPSVFPENSASLAVTSPPYPNAYDYHLYHRYRLFWLNMDPVALRRAEIGAHADYSKKNGPDEFDFQRDMEICFQNTSRILTPGAYYALVIGNSILKGRVIENNPILKKSAERTPFKFVREYSRNLNLRKKSFNPKIGNIKTEKILIFRNEK